MAKRLTYYNDKYDELTYRSANGIKRFVHQKRFVDVIKNIHISKEDQVLDFGTGTGLFLVLLSEKFPDSEMIGLDPAKVMIQQAEANTKEFKNIKIVSELEDNHQKFKVITCLEVLEHFHPIEQTKMIAKLVGLLHNEGTLIISVPVEHGVVGFLKSSYRVLKGYVSIKRTKDIIKTIFGISYRPHSQVYDSSHYGYSLINFEKVIKNLKDVRITSSYSPLKIGGSLLNSQKNFIIKFI